METRIPNVIATQDGGYKCYDTTISARDISSSYKHGLLEVDDDRQRGKDSVTGKAKVDQRKVERWARDLQEDSAIFGQLSWNFRPEEASIQFESDGNGSQDHGTLVIHSGTARLPDSRHRHEAIHLAMASVANGSTFDPNRRFSLRIWNAPADYENVIFNAMNTEHTKADSTRSKWLAQRDVGQKIAAEVVRLSPHLGIQNVETVTNNLSKNNPRLAAFNTISSGFESEWDDIPEADIAAVATWFVGFWSDLVTVLPDLRRLPLVQRQASRTTSLVGWAVTIQGQIRMARRLYDEKIDLKLLKELATKHREPNGTEFELFAWDNPIFQRAGIVVPAVDKQGKTRLTVRNSHQTRRAMADLLTAKLGLPPV